MTDRSMHLSGPTNRLWAAFRNLVKAGLFASRVVVEDLVLSVFRQGLIAPAARGSISGPASVDAQSLLDGVC